ncbi:PREDICTED: L-gulonolactone oxidase-like [Pterocles gutturalis]|uniref:L-gulonolactone oxidase-like n=1 Tax=Pterocles gutturalis TaxID=240206 RepID=UPI000529097A|nr:PREDICTED: L-gulonolactone oxidase-like [Pterocles gutturalis]
MAEKLCGPARPPPNRPGDALPWAEPCLEVHGQGGVKFQNWAKTYGSSPELYFQPTSVEEIREILDMARQRGKRVKVVGGGHSPSDIACTDDFMIHMGKMNRVLKVDKEKQQATVEGGVFLSDLNVELSKHGLALANLGAVSEVAAAGVIGTGTHNTGIKHGILPTQVIALTLLTASGEILECSESINTDIFQAARLHLGCLGIVLTVTFQCVSQFYLHEVAFPSTLTEVLDRLEEHLKRSQYFRFLWFPHSENVSVIYQDPTDKPPSSSASWFWDYAVGYYLLEFLLWISTFVPSLVCWINRFFFWLLFSSRVENIAISYNIFNYECRFKQHVQDWAIPIEKTKEALLELKAALENNPKMVAHYPVEVRFVRGDEIWLSPCFQRDSCYMNIIMYRDGQPPRTLFLLQAHSCTRKDFEKMYPAFPKFCSVREKLDPTGMFLNAYLEKVFY